jgi:hypothetical protein
MKASELMTIAQSEADELLSPLFTKDTDFHRRRDYTPHGGD